MARARKIRPGFTLVELITLVVVSGLIILIVVVNLQGHGPNWHRDRQLKDANQIRNIHQSMVQWALQNNDVFPLPSEFDKDGFTVDVGQLSDPDQAFKLDSTRNIFSLLVFNALAPTQLLISPAEASQITEFEDYMVTDPVGAVDPSRALWDPALRAHASADRIIDSARETIGEGNISYGHAPPFGARRNEMWRDTYKANHAVLGNRGPSYTLTKDTGSWELVGKSAAISANYDMPVGVNSNTLLIHGSRTKWSGNIAYNDGRVIFEAQPDPEHLLFTFASLTPVQKRSQSDNIHMDEDDRNRTVTNTTGNNVVSASTNNRNAFLKIYSDTITGQLGENPTVTVDIFHD